MQIYLQEVLEASVLWLWVTLLTLSKLDFKLVPVTKVPLIVLEKLSFMKVSLVYSGKSSFYL